MSTVLFTFLGRTPISEEGVYRSTRYDFPEDCFGPRRRTAAVAFFGWPLAERLKPDRLVILGTTGSMWDHLFEVDLNLDDELMEQRAALIDATKHRAVRAEHLAALEPLLRERLGCEVRLRLIPYCRTESEQVELLRVLACHVTDKDHVHLDVTHGFRTLPMLGVLAVLYLRRVRRARIDGIWYGPYDPETEEAQVQNLMGLLHVADWLEALTIHDRDGDYGAFADLVGRDGKLLRRAAFFERTSNPEKARESLNTWAGRDDRIPVGDAAAELFSPELDKRVAWRREPDRAAWERNLARIYLTKGDYLRAAIYGMEAIITAKALAQGRNGQDVYTRTEIREELGNETEAFEKLAYIRNALAHGQRRTMGREVVGKLADESKLRAFLEALFEALF